MKLVIIIILSVGILFNSIGNIIIFSIYQNVIRNEVKNYLKSDRSKKKIEILKFSKNEIKYGVIRFVKYDEFIYSNQLYDIKQSKTVGDSVIYFCINDTKEKNLFNKFSKDWEKKSENSTKSFPNKIANLNLSEYLVFYYQYNVFTNILFSLTDYYTNFYDSFVCEPSAPPPKLL